MGAKAGDALPGMSLPDATGGSTSGGGGKSRNLNPSRHLWVGCLVNVSRSKLLDIFAEFGEIEDIHFLKVILLLLLMMVPVRD